jgi:outer membrane protein W
MKGLFLRLALGALSVVFFSACPTTTYASHIHDYVNRDLKIPTNQVSIYFGSREVTDFSALDVDPELEDRNDPPDPGFDPDNTKNLDVSNNLFGGIEYSEIIRDTVGREIGLFYSEEEDATRQTVDNGGTPEVREVKTDIEFIELSLGGRYTYPRFRFFQPYVGGGLDIILADIPKPVNTVENSVKLNITQYPNQRKLLYGGYVHAGVNFRVGSVLMGLDARALMWADEHINYLQLAATIGWGF